MKLAAFLINIKVKNAFAMVHPGDQRFEAFLVLGQGRGVNPAGQDQSDKCNLLNEAKDHSDANDTVTLNAANQYTDDAIAAIDGIDGLQEIETEAVRNANRAGAAPGDPEAGVMRIEVVAEKPDAPNEFTLYVVTG